MKLQTWIAIAFTTLAIASVFVMPQTTTHVASNEQEVASSTPTQGSPFACNRMALNPQTRKRHFDELGPALRSMRKAVRELPNGYEFEFPSDPRTLAMVWEWAAQERLCCPFFNIQILMAAEGGPVWLSLTGRKGTKEFMQVDGAKWIKQ